MSQQVPRQPSAQDAARSDPPSPPPADRPLPDFQPHTPSPYSPIEREIERSERASAALAAARALARASFTDSELAADDDAGLHDFETGSWTRTEYAPLDESVRAHDDERAATPRNLLGGTFNPGIAAQHGRQFPGASIAHTPIKTRSGAHARFAQESRHAPRAERAASAVARTEPAPSAAHYDKPAVLPMLAPPAMAPVVLRAPAATRVAAAEPAKFLLAAAIGAVVVLIGGGLAWNAGLLSRNNPNNAAIVTPAVAAQAEAARVLSAAQDIPLAPAAGVPSQRTNEEVDAALAAAARAAAVPAASVRAAGPARVGRPLPLVATPVVAAPAASSARRDTPQGKDSVAAAIANAQARADRFLASDNASSAAASSGTTEAKPAQ